MLEIKYWFLNEYWRKKALREKFVFSLGTRSMELFNFGFSLDAPTLDRISRTLAEYASLQNGVFDRLKFIIIDDNQLINPNTGEPMNGNGGQMDGAIKLYPNAFKNMNHRVVGVPNLEGTVIHELSHSISLDFRNAWKKKFGWVDLENGGVLPGGAKQYHRVADPSRCVTRYAEVSADEDVCESMVAALKNPNVLDLERLHFIEESFSLGEHKNSEIVEVQKIDSPTLPEISQPIRYKRVSPKKFEIKT